MGNKFKCPKKLNKISCDILKSLDGEEVRSLKYEDVVGVKGNKVISGGKTIDTLNTNAKVRSLFRESFVDEFGFEPGSKQHSRRLKEEFG